MSLVKKSDEKLQLDLIPSSTSSKPKKSINILDEETYIKVT